MSFKIEKGSYTNTLDSASLSGNQTITLPNATGMVALTNQFAKVATSGSYNDLSNKPSIPSTPQGYVTQTWRSGNNWYRVWSDGFIEQGGRATQNVASLQINLHRNYSSTNYIRLTTKESNNNNWTPAGSGWGISNVSTSSFKCGSTYDWNVSGGYFFNWYTAGY